MRRPVIAGNWKMNMLQSEAEDLVKNLLAWEALPPTVDIILAPPFTALAVVRRSIEHSAIELAGQNMHGQSNGPWTGEISPAMLKDAGCRFVILGHSERRTHFHEDDALINGKIKAALKNQLQVIFCVGETLEQRMRERTREVIERQLKNGLQGLAPGEIKNIMIAYEPVWAIGTGKTATPEQAREVHEFARALVAKTFGDSAAENTRILYGGSVSPENSRSLLDQQDIDGALVGSASLKFESFRDIIRSADQS